ncbi:MAG: hypothetical protein LRY51_04560 [Geovibrio sp.]|nr:hypothetical protein [Geovibrio sp.]
MLFFSAAAYGADSVFPPETISHLDILNSGRITVIGSSPGGLNMNNALRRARIDAEEKAHALLSDLPVSGLRTLEDAALFDNESEHYFSGSYFISFPLAGAKVYRQGGEKKVIIVLTGRTDPP